jgi:hypothetical protein
MLIISNIGDQVWLMTSKQTDPDLCESGASQHLQSLAKHLAISFNASNIIFLGCHTHSSSMLGWNMRLTKPMLGDLYG